MGSGKIIIGNVMAAEQDIQQVRKIIQARLAQYPVRIFLFGSHATGQARSTSDVDVAVLPEIDLPAGLLSQVREDLEESNVLYTVDLVDIAKTDEAFRQRVLSEGVEWVD
jgi:predicted nucleotidyltransferase